MLGRADPDAMLAGMDEELFQRWWQFWREEPFGPQTETLMAAQCAAAAAGGDPQDFMPLTVGG